MSQPTTTKTSHRPLRPGTRFRRDVEGIPSWGMRIVGLFRAMRPHQWSKNLVCFAGLIFSGQLFRLESMASALLAFFGFCLASSACYLVNDLCDREADRLHPEKRSRPLASGVVPARWAVVGAVTLMALALITTRLLPPLCFAVLASYFVLTLAYSLRLKHRMLVDVISIALGFVLRLICGVFAVGVRPTAWIVLCMFFLALFLGFAKRRGELSQALGAGAGMDHLRRPVLQKYRLDLLDLLLAMTATMAICFYALYTVAGRPDHDTLVVTVPLVFLGIARYMTLVLRDNLGESPERHILGDWVSQLIVALWVVLCVAILYSDVQIFARVEMIRP